jgi:hypothetical protein
MSLPLKTTYTLIDAEIVIHFEVRFPSIIPDAKFIWAANRVRKPSEEKSRFIVFDLLVNEKGESLKDNSLKEGRRIFFKRSRDTTCDL